MGETSFNVQRTCECPRSRLKKVSISKKSKSKKNERLNKLISWGAGISLLIAFLYGMIFNQPDFTGLISQQLESQQVTQLSENEYQITSSYNGEEKTGLIKLSEESGYGGPLVVGPVIDADGSIEQVLLVDNSETHSFIRKLISNNFFKQFSQKHVSDPLILGEDVDVVSGATISCVAITDAVRKSAHMIGQHKFDISYVTIATQWEITLKDYLIAILFTIAVVAVLSGKKWLRYLSLGVSMIFLGFYFNSAVNVSHFGRVLLGYIPAFRSHIFWYILVFGSIGFAFFLKKNVYCNTMCPFHAIETILVRIGGMKIKFTPKIQKIAKHSAKFLLWLSLMLTFLSQNPTIASFEPFAMVFGLEGDGIQWYILPAVLIGVLLITDYFCRYFCPVGKGFWYVINLRKWIDKQVISFRSTTLKKIN